MPRFARDSPFSSTICSGPTTNPERGGAKNPPVVASRRPEACRRISVRFDGRPKKPASGNKRKPKEEKLEEPAATVLPKKAKAEEPKPDVDMVDLTDDEPAPKTVANARRSSTM